MIKGAVLSKCLKDVGGAALVEMSLLLFPLTGLMVGAVEYGRVFQQYHVASKGVTAASRYLARVNNATLCDGTPGGNWANDVADAKDLAQRGILEKGNGASASHILNTWSNHNQITVTINCANNPTDGTTGVTTFRGTAQLPRITVATNFVYDELGLFGLIDSDGVTITASHTELYIGG